MSFSLLKSRTVWTVFLMFVVGGVNAITQFLPPEIQSTAMAVLSGLAVYFHTNPSQTYNPPLG
jgi:hypothetical protein